jgi:hypothetical protein
MHTRWGRSLGAVVCLDSRCSLSLVNRHPVSIETPRRSRFADAEGVRYPRH